MTDLTDRRAKLEACPECGATRLDCETIWIHEYVHSLRHDHELAKLPFSLVPAVAAMLREYVALWYDEMR
jgi:hypothetical protein